MPDREQILTGLTTAANHYVALAVAWHAVTLVAIIALAAGWRPSRRLAGSLLAAPLISVSAVAWVSGNPFNGAVFAAASLALIVLAAACTSRERVSLAPRGSQLVGAALVAFEASARLGSFTRAAEELNLTQGAISRQIKLLEDQLGITLFDVVAFSLQAQRMSMPQVVVLRLAIRAEAGANLATTERAGPGAGIARRVVAGQGRGRADDAEQGQQAV